MFHPDQDRIVSVRECARAQVRPEALDRLASMFCAKHSLKFSIYQGILKIDLEGEVPLQ